MNVLRNKFLVFLLSKPCLAPIKEKSLTIPRLELQAAVLAMRLKNTISKLLDFSIDETRFWSDSQVVLKYTVNKDTRFPVSVMNRLNEIRLLSTPEQWHYVPTSEILLTFAHVLFRLVS